MLARFVEYLTTQIQEIIGAFDALGIVLIAFLENIFPPTPSEILYPIAGKVAYDGQANLLFVILAGGIGSLIGSLLFYGLGYSLGERRVRGFVRRYGTLRFWHIYIRLFTVNQYDRAQLAFRRHGAVIVLVARLMPVIHSVISIPAGVARMNLFVFSVFTFFGSLLWIGPTVLLGYFLGNQWDTVIIVLDVYEYFWYLLFLVVLIYFAFIWMRNNRHEPAADAD